MSLRTRSTLIVLAALALVALASMTLLPSPASQSASAFGLLGLLGGIVSLGANSVALPFGAVLLPTLTFETGHLSGSAIAQ